MIQMCMTRQVKHFHLQRVRATLRDIEINALADGCYSVIVIDARVDDTGDAHFELTITSGENKGDVVRVRTRFDKRDVLDMLGLPASLKVIHGEPRVLWDAP